MRVSRLYIECPLSLEAPVELSGERAHYLGTVLRHREGDQVQLFNGQDGEYLAEITGRGNKNITLALLKPVRAQTEPVLPVHIAIGLSRGERMDFVVQKCTELGASSIQPLFSERCEVKLDEKRAAKRQAHWQKVAVSATEQSGRCQPPAIQAPMPLGQWLNQERSGDCLVLDPTATSRLSLVGDHARQSVTLLSGPEGGLSEEEVTAAARHGFRPVNLGPRTLRTETAPLAALSILQYLAGDL